MHQAAASTKSGGDHQQLARRVYSFNLGMDVPCSSEKYCGQLAPQDLCQDCRVTAHCITCPVVV